LVEVGPPQSVGVRAVVVATSSLVGVVVLRCSVAVVAELLSQQFVERIDRDPSGIAPT